MAGADRYIPLAMIVDIDEPWLPPHIFTLTGPKDWRPRLSRKIFHEAVHYWQYIGHAHLIRLVEEDWLRLRRFVDAGQAAPAGPLRRAFAAPVQPAGFSTLDLTECHARFWDVQAIGPPLLIEMELDDPHRGIGGILTRAQYEGLKADGQIWRHIDEEGCGYGYSSLSFDLAMRLAAGRYALPYLRLVDMTNTLVALSLFPLCSHFALHSEAPVAFYLDLVARLAPSVDLAPGRTMESNWRGLYDEALKAAELLHVERHGCEFLTGQATMHHSAIYDHPGYRLTHTLLSMACDHLEKARPPEFLIGPEAMPSDMRALWTMDFLLGCCGMTDSREADLLAFLAPPVIRFDDGRIWCLGEVFDRLPYSPTPPETIRHPPPRAQTAAALLDVDVQRERMLQSVLGY